jgi:prepilin-type N-terminal cleavage/methylation domain-containing protein
LKHRGGFTLVEILIALGLAGLIVAGALQMHAAFNRQSERQNQISDVQQTLRLAMAILARSVRSAGYGMPNGMLAWDGCASPPIYGFQYYNHNTNYPPLAAGTDSTAGDYDTDPTRADKLDPDWFRVVSATSEHLMVQSDNGSQTQILPLSATANIRVNDLLVFAVQQPPQPPPPPLAPPPALPAPQGYWPVREVTGIFGTTGPYGRLNPGVRYPCANPSGGSVSDGKMAGISGGKNEYPVYHFDQTSETAFRVILPPSPLPPGGAQPPRLAMKRGRVGDTSLLTTPWLVIADNIEDMQIALIMNDGRLCADVDDPALCDPSKIKAVRITLVGRSPTPIQGPPTTYLGGYEDESLSPTPTPANDGYIRRSLTQEIELRNSL